MVNWPDGPPRWEPYLCWQVDVDEPDAVERVMALARREFKGRHGQEPEHVFYHLRAVYAGPVREG